MAMFFSPRFLPDQMNALLTPATREAEWDGRSVVERQRVGEHMKPHRIDWTTPQLQRLTASQDSRGGNDGSGGEGVMVGLLTYYS